LPPSHRHPRYAEAEMSGLKTFLPGLAESAIDLAAVTDVVDRDLQSCSIQFVHDPIVTDSNSIEPFSALQLGRLARKGIALKLIEAVKDAGDEWLGQGVEVSFDGWLEAEAIGGHVFAAASSYPRG